VVNEQTHQKQKIHRSCSFRPSRMCNVVPSSRTLYANDTPLHCTAQLSISSFVRRSHLYKHIDTDHIETTIERYTAVRTTLNYEWCCNGPLPGLETVFLNDTQRQSEFQFIFTRYRDCNLRLQKSHFYVELL
jgi:hypothetical protein